MATQKCPGCGSWNDVSVFVSGQRVRCSICKLPFTVQRKDSQVLDPVEARVGPRPRRGAPVGPAPAGEQRPAIRPHPAVVEQEQRERGRQRHKEPPPAGGAPQAGAREDTAPGGELKIPGYELFEVIGKGGMGRVYRARQSSLERLVAIKVLNQDLAKHQSFIRRFEKETASLAAMSHPNISAIIDRGHVGGLWYFIMEYIDGPSLRQLINRERFDLDRLLEIFDPLCRAVAHAHQRKVIHRDLKPENVLFTSDGVLKVVDFGLANILAGDERWSLTRTKVSMGTVNYMAPEQRRDAKHVDHRADVYSLGVMLYELLVGELPLGRFDPPSKQRAGLDPRVDELVLQMLSFDKQARPHRADEVLAELHRLAGGPPAAAEAAPAQPGPNPAAEPDPDPAAEPDPEPAPGAEPRGAVPSALPLDAAETGGPPPPDPPSQPDPLAPQPAGAPRPASDRRWRRGLPVKLLMGVLGLAALAGGAVAVFSWLLSSEVDESAADLVLRREGGVPQVNLVLPRQVKHVSPSAVRRLDGRSTVHFDFKPSRLEPMPVRLVGGSWSWEDGQGALIQDTCRQALTVNQRPATATFGPLRVAEGLELVAEVTATPATYDDGSGPVPLQRYLRERLSDAYRLARVDAAQRVGLGFIAEAGGGIAVLLPLAGGGPGRLVRTGAGMELPSRDFVIEAAPDPTGGSQRLRLRVDNGRLRLELGDQLLVDELTGLPLQFRGRPALACQNARCRFERVTISQ